MLRRIRLEPLGSLFHGVKLVLILLELVTTASHLVAKASLKWLVATPTTATSTPTKLIVLLLIASSHATSIIATSFIATLSLETSIASIVLSTTVVLGPLTHLVLIMKVPSVVMRWAISSRHKAVILWVPASTILTIARSYNLLGGETLPVSVFLMISSAESYPSAFLEDYLA